MELDLVNQLCSRPQYTHSDPIVQELAELLAVIVVNEKHIDQEISIYPDDPIALLFWTASGGDNMTPVRFVVESKEKCGVGIDPDTFQQLADAGKPISDLFSLYSDAIGEGVGTVS